MHGGAFAYRSGSDAAALTLMDPIASDPKTETAPGSRAASGCSGSLRLWLAREIREARWMAGYARTHRTSFDSGFYQGEITALVKLAKTPHARKKASPNDRGVPRP